MRQNRIFTALSLSFIAVVFLAPFSQLPSGSVIRINTSGAAELAHSTFRFVDLESLAPIRPRSLLVDGYEIAPTVGVDGVVELDLSAGEHAVEVLANGYRPMRARHGAAFPYSVINVFYLVPELEPSAQLLEHTAKESHRVSGWVRSRESLRTIQDAHVFFESPAFTTEAITDPAGEFAFTVPANAFQNEWQIRAEARNRQSSRLASRGQVDLPSNIRHVFLLARETDAPDDSDKAGFRPTVRLPSKPMSSLSLLLQTPPNTIRVGLGAPRASAIACSGFNEKCSSSFNACSPTNIDVVDIETYVKRVFRGELFGTVIWDEAELECFKATAVAIRSYASFHALSSPRGSQYDICNSDSCQCYFSNFSAFGPISTAASQQTAGQVLLTHNDQIPKSEYGSWNGSCARGIIHCTAEAGYPNLYSIYDYAIDQNWNLRPSNPELWGHGRGMSQYGSHFRAKNGETYQQILTFYYQDYGWRLSTSPSQTLTVNLVPNPSSGTAPLPVSLTASISGTASGMINYTFWWNCSSASNSVSEVTSVCGDPRDPIRGAKFDGVSDNPKAVMHLYTSSGSYTAKVIVERGTAPPAEQRFSIGVTGGSCNYSIDPSSLQFGSNGGSGNVSVTAPNGCSWNASSNTNWITINSGNSGSGNGQVGYTIQPNGGQAQRTSTITVAGQTHTITQQGVSCNYSIDPPSRQFDSNGGSGNVSVIAPSGCSWTATSNANWITVTSGGSGSGNGSVIYFVATNSSTGRTGTIAIAGQTFTVMQGAACSSNCPATFTEVSTSLIGVSNSFVAWGDYDNDGDLDILLTGQTNTGQRIAKIYQNDGSGIFTDIQAALTGVLETGEGSSAWGDYDNDGDLDILLTGSGSGDLPVTKIYRNDNGNFVDINASLTPVRNSSVVWGDYDNDGDLDILLTGATGSGSVSKIYRNDGGGVFTDINASLPGVADGCVSWADYDGDGDLDILLTGSSSSVLISKIYRNDSNGAFTDINASLPGVVGSAAWGDYDNDGDLDILLTGISPAGAIAGIYRNDSGIFINIPVSLRVAEFSSVAWGDYDNDGDLDILLTGNSYSPSGSVAKVYRNDGGSFVDVSAPLTGVARGSVAWGDYDNDGDLDILLSGDTGTNYISKIYRNNIGTANAAPSAPTGLAATVTENSVTLTWNKSSDSKTAQNALTYNLRIGTSAGGVQKLSPMANATTGYRKAPKLGNAGHKNAWTIKNLSNGTYYWSIQAIDNAFAGSTFAPEQTFVIQPPSVSIQVTVQTNPSGRSFTVDGATYTAVQTFTWASGSTHTIGTTNPQSGGAGTQYVWSNWSDGGGISHTVSPTSNTTYTASFVTQHYLTMSAGAGGAISPSSNWYNSGQRVTIMATPNNGYSFNGWSGSGTGSYTGSSNPATVTMNGAITEMANFVIVTRPVACVSAASYSALGIATEAIVAAFGSSLATATLAASTNPLPTTLAGTTVRVKDGIGAERLAPLFLVSPAQINFQVPPGTASGTAIVTITSGDGSVSSGTAQIASVAPGLFSANANGQGVAAAVVLRVKADGSQVYEPVTRFDPAQNRFVAAPIDLGPPTDQVFLILYGAGIRHRSSMSSVASKIGGVDAQALFAGAQGGFVGLDQVNLRVPRSLIGRGEVDIVLTVDGKVANTVKASIK